MFWRKKNQADAFEGCENLLTLAADLRVELRKNERVSYPPRARVCRLPRLFYDGKNLQLKNISLGGCCVLDPHEILGSSIGGEIELDLDWATGQEKVKARIVSRVDHRRHIQFLNLNQQRKNSLKKSIAAGLRGLHIRRNASVSQAGPRMDAVELWSSFQGDNVVIERLKQGRIYFRAESYLIYPDAWPVKSNVGSHCSRMELERLILFLSNVPAPSAGLALLIEALEDQWIKGRA